MKRILTKLAAAFLVFFLLPTEVQAAELLIPGGQIIGLQLDSQTITVAAFDDVLGANAKAAGLRIGDELLSINGNRIQSPEDIREILDGAPENVTLTILRKGKTQALDVTPQASRDGSRLGIYLKQGIAGIGTITWIDPETRLFGALGHGVSDGHGNLLPMTQGTAFHAQVESIRKGICGQPGQLKGSAEAFQSCGKLRKNAPQGVFGTLTETCHGEALPTAEYDDIQPGAACIRSAVIDGSIREYSVEIMKIYAEDRSDGRNFLLKVTDQKLLDTTGGIVQGMSGSPIIQDGKLVGAVTHVLVNDPTRGYGIFIENMLDAAK